jgi:hypothetical protein
MLALAGKTRNSAIDKRTTRHQGYGMSRSRRAMVECIFGWARQHGTMRKTKHRGIGRVAHGVSGLLQHYPPKAETLQCTGTLRKRVEG